MGSLERSLHRIVHPDVYKLRVFVSAILVPASFTLGHVDSGAAIRAASFCPHAQRSDGGRGVDGPTRWNGVCGLPRPHHPLLSAGTRGRHSNDGRQPLFRLDQARRCFWELTSTKNSAAFLSASV